VAAAIGSHLPLACPVQLLSSTVVTLSLLVVLLAVAGRKNHDNYKSWEFEDAHLTEFGWQQVRLGVEHALGGCAQQQQQQRQQHFMQHQ
jgi:hypothetical protein